MHFCYVLHIVWHIQAIPTCRVYRLDDITSVNAGHLGASLSECRILSNFTLRRGCIVYIAAMRKPPPRSVYSMLCMPTVSLVPRSLSA